MADELKTERVQLMMSPSEVTEIDEWAHGKRIRSRSEAIRKLLEIGMQNGASVTISDLIKGLRSIAGYEFGSPELSELSELMVVISRVIHHSLKASTKK